MSVRHLRVAYKAVTLLIICAHKMNGAPIRYVMHVQMLLEHKVTRLPDTVRITEL